MPKVFLLFFILLCVTTIRIKHLEQPPIRLRKSVNALNETQRKSLFWSIKMMAVLPAPDRFQNWTYLAFINLPKGNATVQPLRIADILISSHSSSCEHANFYFAHYHRHLMIHSEIWINFVHQTLRGGKQRLLELYPAELYQSHPKEWDAVFQEYTSSGAAGLPFISLHYWNPTNYNNKEDLVVPKELARHHENRNKIVDVVDKLFYAVLGYWPWQVNARTRLTSPNFEWNQDQFQKQMEISQAFDYIGESQPWTTDEDNIQKFRMTPRIQPEGQDYDDYIKSYAHFQNTRARFSPFISHTRRRFREYFHGIGNNVTIPLSAVSENEIYILDGAKVEYRQPGNQSNIIRVQNQYISKEERRGLNLASGPTSDYNTLLPHFVMAYAFYNDQAVPTFKDFLESEEGIARPHNYMHGYHGFFLRDALYSIATLFFYPFHSWVDAMLEIKIRLSNFEDSFNTGKSHYNTTKDYLDSKKTNQTYRFTMLLNDETDPEYVDQVAALIDAETQKFYEMIAANNQSIFPELPGKDTVGSHMVIEWTNHFMNTTLIENKTVSRAFLPAFSMKDYILTTKRLRNSKDLGDLYRDVYVKNHKEKFDGLIDITNFPFDYDYQVYDGKGKPTPTLDDSASNVARYIRQMFDDVRSSYKPYIPAMRTALIKVLGGDEQTHKPNETYYKSILFNTSFIHVKYQSNIPHNHYPITLNLQETESLPRVQALLESWNISDAVVDDLIDGIKVESLNTKKCKKQCNATKQILLELDTDVLETNLDVWEALRVLLLGDNQILKDSRQPSFLDGLAQTLKLKSKQESKEIQVDFLKGAEKIKLYTEFAEVPQEKRAILEKNIRVTAKAGAVGADDGVDEVTIRMQAQNSRDARFIFEPIVPSSQPKVSNHIDSLLYKHIQIQWNNAVVLQFNIPFFSKTANYRLFVGLDESSKPYFCLEDADFAVKHEFLVEALNNTD